MRAFKNHIERAIKCCGSQAKLAEAMGCSQQQISYMLNRASRVSAEMALRIEAATDGEVPRYDLRPDIFGVPEAAE